MLIFHVHAKIFLKVELRMGGQSDDYLGLGQANAQSPRQCFSKKLQSLQYRADVAALLDPDLVHPVFYTGYSICEILSDCLSELQKLCGDYERGLRGFKVKARRPGLGSSGERESL